MKYIEKKQQGGKDLLSTEELVKKALAFENEPLLWVQKNVKTPKGEALDFNNHQYLIDIYEDPTPNIVIKKAAQVGITTFGMNKALWFADNNDCSVIYTLPTGGDVYDFSRARMNPIIKASPYLSRVMADSTDSLGLKQIRQSFIYFRGAWSERQAISVDSDFNIHDEIDFSKPDILDMYRERLSHSKHKLILAFSTPSIPSFGIDYLYERTDKKEWFVECPKCKKPQILKYPDSIKGDTQEARFACVYCRATITNDDRRNGYWKPTGSKEWGVSGYHITQLMAPWISATEILQKEEKSRLNPVTQLSGIKDFHNFVLGEAYGGENQPLNREILLSCIENKYDLETKGRNTVMGIDQGDDIHVVIFNKEPDRRARLIHVGVYKDFDRDLPNLMDKYGVTFCVIDALPNKHSARKFALMYQGKVWLAYYNDSQKETIVWRKNPDNKEYHVVAAKMETVDRLADKFVNHQIILPKLSQEIDLYMRHLCNWAKDREEKPDGRVAWVYKKLGAEHLTMATNYAMLGLDKLSTGSLAEPNAEDIPKKDKPITAGILNKKF